MLAQSSRRVSQNFENIVVIFESLNCFLIIFSGHSLKPHIKKAQGYSASDEESYAQMFCDLIRTKKIRKRTKATE